MAAAAESQDHCVHLHTTDFLAQTFNKSFRDRDLNNIDWSASEIVKNNADNPAGQQSMRHALVDLYGQTGQWQKGASVMDQIVAVDELRAKQEPGNAQLPTLLFCDKAAQSAFHDADLAAKQGQEVDPETQLRRLGQILIDKKIIQEVKASQPKVEESDPVMKIAADALVQTTKLKYAMPEPKASADSKTGKNDIEEPDMVP